MHDICRVGVDPIFCTRPFAGPYYAFDVPAGTEMALRQYFNTPAMVNENSTAADNQTFSEFNVKYQLLYSLYSIPNCVRGALWGPSSCNGVMACACRCCPCLAGCWLTGGACVP
jgi:hypothetical protein